MTSSHQQSLADAGLKNRPPMLEKGNTRPTNQTNAPRTKTQTEVDLTDDEKKRFEAYIDAMNMILLGIPNDIYNSIDACQTAKATWNRIKRLMQGTELSQQERDSRLMNEFDKFSAKPGESLEYGTKRFLRLMNNMERNKVLPNKIAINTKILNSLQFKWTARNHDPLALVANTYASPSYSRFPQSYYVTHPPSVHDFDDDYQGEVKDIQSKNVGMLGMVTGRIIGNHGSNVGNGFGQKNVGNANNVQRIPRTTANSGKTSTIQCYNCNEKGATAVIVSDVAKLMIMALEDYGYQIKRGIRDDFKKCLGITLLMSNAKVVLRRDKDFRRIGVESDLVALPLKKARFRMIHNDSDAEPTYDSDFVIEVKGRQVEHAYYAHDQKLDAFESLITNVQIEVENQRMVNKEMKRKNALITKELETYKERHLTDGTLSCYKARLMAMANDSTQLSSIDVDETFSPVVKPATIRTILSLATSRHWPISLYDLKQAHRAWFQRFAVYITRIGFTHNRCDSSLFIYRQGPDTACLLLYVDDIVLTASSEVLLQHMIGLLHQEFSMMDLGLLNYFMGIFVVRDSPGMFLSQHKYVVEILERAHMVHCNPSRTPVDTKSKLDADGDSVSDPILHRSLVGALQYLTFTRPDFSYAVQHVCLSMHDPRDPHFLALKRILRYVRGTVDHGVVYLSSNLVQHQRTKHIEIDIHFVRDLVAASQVRVLHVPSRYQYTNIFTKGLPSALFEEFRTSLRVWCPPAQTAGEC
ncbi:ribonuclease H-like domain-containing protein [Tanacetum coccineum]